MKVLYVFFAIFWIAQIPFMIFTDYTPNVVTTSCAFYLAGLGSLMARGDSR